MAGTLTIHYGLPGTGKTLFALNDVIIPAVRQGRPFFTNITGISLSGLFAVAGVHQSSIRYYQVKDIHDVIAYFDDPEVCHDGVFVLDEMKDFVNDEKAVSWLESRINVMRKQTVDFVLIAQLPEKEYIHPHIMQLAESCNVAVSRKKYGDTDYVDWYYVDGGIPRIVNKRPVNAAGSKKRKKPVEVFSCYKTAENAFYKGEEDKTYRGLFWWQTRTAKLRFLLLGLFGLVVIGFIWIGSTFADMVSDVDKKEETTTLETEVKDGLSEGNRAHNGVDNSRAAGRLHEQSGQRRDQERAASQLAQVFGARGEGSCYKWRICSETSCKTDIGTFNLEMRGAVSNRLCDSRKRCYGPCEDDSVLSGGRGLLRARDTLPARD